MGGCSGVSGTLTCWPLASPFLSPRPICLIFLGKPPPPAHASASAASPPASQPAGAATHSSCVSGLSLLGTERRELTEKLEEGGGGWGESGTARGPGRAKGGEEGWSSPALVTLAQATLGPHKGGPSRPLREAILSLGLAGADRVYFPFVPSMVCRGRRVLSSWG